VVLYLRTPPRVFSRRRGREERRMGKDVPIGHGVAGGPIDDVHEGPTRPADDLTEKDVKVRQAGSARYPPLRRQPRGNINSISHRCYPILVAFLWD